MKFRASASVVLGVAWCVAAQAASGGAGQVNVALGAYGATAWASSQFGPDYAAGRVLDGRWARRETDKWNSRSNATPHWLVIDLGARHQIGRVVIRHEGVLPGGEGYNTGAYELQAGAGPEGPWSALAPSVRGNRRSVTEHLFAPRPVRWLRLWITQGEPGGNEFARIFEVEAYAREADLDAPLARAYAPARWRAASGGVVEQAVCVEGAGPGLSPPARRAQLSIDGRDVALARSTPDGPFLGWLPAVDAPRSVRATLRTQDAAARPLALAFDLPGSRDVQGLGFPARFAQGRALAICSSHQDIAWMDTPARCIRQRDEQVITPALELLRRDPSARFVMEDTLALMEYLERHPDRKPEVLALTRARRLEWGATYNQPYEGLLSGEMLARQLYFGRRWLQKALPGCDARAAWSPDVPGRALQMPQILAKAGAPYLMLSRQEPGFFRWRSPDGSSVLAYSPGHYGTAWDRLTGPVGEVARRVAHDAAAVDAAQAAAGLPPLLAYIVSVDASGPRDFGDLIRQWPVVEGNGAAPGLPAVPAFATATAEEMMDQVASARPKVRTIQGERPNVWLYIHGPTHHHAIRAGREAARLLPAAEAFSALANVRLGSAAPYPAKELDAAWRALLYPDHGWGGYYGEITDDLFRAKLTQARDAGRGLLGAAISRLAARVPTAPGPGVPLAVFNTQPWSRTGLLEATVALPRGVARSLEVRRPGQAPMPAQLLGGTRWPDGSLKSATVAAAVSSAPSLGYTSVRLAPARAASTGGKAVGSMPTELVSPFYRVRLAPGGIREVVDLATGKSLFDTRKWLAGELFTMQSEGNGAGEFDKVQQPTMEQFDRASNHRPVWRVVADGPLFIAVEWSMPRSAEQMRHASFGQRLALYKTLKRIDLETHIRGWDGTPYREFRLAFPTPAGRARVAYHVPMGVCEVGKGEIAGAAGERYTQPCAEARPREVQEWIAAFGDGACVALTSDVAVWDWADPTPNPAAGALLQPVLLASRRSCHGLGNWYLQPGDHSFRFSITSAAGDWRSTRRAASDAGAPLWSAPARGGRNGLPPQLSFCSASGRNVDITAVKRAEDGLGLAVRLCDMDGVGGTVRLDLSEPVVDARSANLIEYPGGPLRHAARSVEAPVGAYAIETLLVRPGLSAAPRRTH
ncbi:MAG: discoidin domain-containing protein [Armatimonadetes bacterium]|nr:discoidin domain-containing protein [Armatimonadota bacterium]